MFDEVYIKKALLFHGGSVFGKVVNNPTMLATSGVGVMVECLHGGPVYLSKMPNLCLMKLVKQLMLLSLLMGKLKF